MGVKVFFCKSFKTIRSIKMFLTKTVTHSIKQPNTFTEIKGLKWRFKPEDQNSQKHTKHTGSSKYMVNSKCLV